MCTEAGVRLWTWLSFVNLGKQLHSLSLGFSIWG